jgi:hypothetical protein
MKRTLIASAAAMSLGLLANHAALAGDTAATPSPIKESTARRGPFGSVPLSAAALASKRGGDGTLNDTQLKGEVSNNQASHVVTGANTIGEGAFAGAAGISTVIQNTGNNVLIQNATVVNLQMK